MTITLRRRGRRAFGPLLAAAGVAALAACGGAPPDAPAAGGTRVVTDLAGSQVTIPAQVERVGEQYPAHTVFTIMLGGGDKIAAITTNVRTLPFLAKVYPRITEIPELFPYDGTAANVEELLALKIDTVFSYNGNYSGTGLANLNLQFADYEQLAKVATITGEVLGGDAPARAQAYVDYLHKNLELVRSRLAGLTDADRPTVAHVPSFPPLTVDGGGSAQGGLWINTAGGRSAFADVAGTYVTVSAEEMLRHDPDVIVVQAPRENAPGQQVVAALQRELPVWDDLSAVRDQRVHLNPRGLYPWERSTPEQALQILWAAKALHPDRFADIDVRAEARNFYRQFFGYEVTDAELDEIFQNTR